MQVSHRDIKVHEVHDHEVQHKSKLEGAREEVGIVV